MSDDTHFTEKIFLRNVKEARECGYDLLCAVCGVGIYDDSDEHEAWCPQSRSELREGHPYRALRERLRKEICS